MIFQETDTLREGYAELKKKEGYRAPTITERFKDFLVTTEFGPEINSKNL